MGKYYLNIYDEALEINIVNKLEQRLFTHE